MKPVELEIFLQDGVSPGLKRAGEAVSRFSRTTKADLREVTESLKLQKLHVSRLEAEVKSLEKACNSSVPGGEKMAMEARLASLRKELEEEKATVSQLTEEQDTLKRKLEAGGASLRAQLKTIREEIATLLLAYRSLTDTEKESAQGRALAQHIDELTEKAGELNDAIMDTSQAVTNAASDTRGFDQMAGAMQLVVDGFGLATAGAQALGLSEEDLMEVQTRLQTALVASNALTSMQANLQRQSALMQGVAAIQAKAATAAETAKAWAVGRGTVATTAATVAQAAFNAVAKANPYVLLAMAVVTVVGALYAFAKGSKEAAKAQEERRAKMEKARQAEEDFRKAVVDAAGGQIATFIRLKKAWEDLGDSFSKKQKFIADTKEEWRGLGREISSVNDMERMFRDHTKDMLDAIITRAELKAYEKRIDAVADEMVDEVEKNKKFTYVKATSDTKFNDLTEAEKDAIADRNNRGFFEINDKNKKNLRRVKGFSAYWALSEEGAEIVNEMRRTAGNAAALARQKSAKEEGQQRISGYLDEIGRLDKELDSTLSKLPGKTVTPEPDGRTPSNPDDDDRVKAEAKANDQLRELRMKNQQEEIDQLAEGNEKRRRQIALDYEKEKEEIERMRQSFATANAEASVKGLDADGLTADQATAISEATELNERKRQRAVAETYQEESRLMREQLREYGTYQQQRLAITSEYDEKIGKAGSEAERQRLARERDSLLAGVKGQELKSDIDWGVVFGEFGGMFKSVVGPVLEKAKEYTQTEEFRNADHASQQALIETIRQMELSAGVTGKVSFEKLGNEVTALQKALADLTDAEEKYEKAYDALKTAQDNYAKAQASGTDQQKAAATEALETAEANEAAAASNVSALQQTAEGAQQAVTTTATTLKASMEQVVGGLQKLASGSLGGAYQGLIEAGKGIKNLEKMPKQLADVMGKVSDKLESVPIVGWILSIIDIFKDGISVVISGLLDAVFDAVSGILDDVLSGDLFASLGKSIVSGIGKIFDAITFGGFSSWFSPSGNSKSVQLTLEQLTERNATLQTAIERLTDEIKAGKGAKSVAAYREAYGNQAQINENLLAAAYEQAGYHKSHHSWNYYWDKSGGFNAGQIARLSGQIGRQWDGSIWSLSPEEMARLRENADMWRQIYETGGDYGRRVVERLEEYIAQGGKMEELTTQLYEGLTGITFDSMYDSFIDQLMDMDASAEDFADNVSGYFMRAMLSNKIGELYADRLEEWWERFGAAMADDGALDAGERGGLMEDYMAMVDEAIKLRDSLAAATGYDPASTGGGQSGRPGGFNAMSQDQGTKLEGLFVSVQGHVANIDGNCESVVEKMSAAEGYLAKIADNTGASAGHLAMIEEMLETIRRDGVKTR